MSFNLLLALLFALLIAIFAAQNAQPVEVRFLSWTWVTSLVLVIVGSAALGVLLAGTLSLVRQVSMRV
ncbi:MAG TPA: LapA family protein, partial [Bacillota bacterium]